MNVGELKKALGAYPEDMEVIIPVYSDYQLVVQECIGEISAVNKGYYIMQSHPTMDEINKTNERTYLLIGQ